MSTTSDIQTNLHLAQSCILELKNKYPSYTSNQIADKIGVPQPTFNRIENGQTKNPTLATISKFLSALKKTHMISEAIQLTNPDLSEAFKENLSHNIDTPFAGGEIKNFFELSEYRNILLLALTRTGTSKTEVKEEFGNQGVKKLEEMILAGALIETGKVIRAIEEKLTFQQEDLKAALSDCIAQNYNSQGFGTGENWLSFQTESINLAKAMPVIRHKLQKTYKEIKEEILYSPDYYGTDKVFIGMVSDTFGPNIKKSQKEDIQ